MKTKLVTLLALLLAGGTLSAQTNAPTLLDAWNDLRKSQGKNFDASSPEAEAIVDQVIAQDAIPQKDVIILLQHYNRLGKPAVYIAAANLASKSPYFAALHKVNQGDSTGWSEEMMKQNLNAAALLALRGGTSKDFRDQLWAVASERPALSKPHMTFFKRHRATLPKEEQITSTQRQKDLLVSQPNRDADEDAWLAEMAADLIALQLEQPAE